MSTKALIVFGFSVMFLVGCTQQDGGFFSFKKVDSGAFEPLTEQSARIVTSDENFAQADTTRVGFTGFDEYEEYALFRSAYGQAEMYFARIRERRQGRYVLDFNKLISDTLPMWRFNQNKTLEFQPSIAIATDFASIWTQRYRHVEDDRACVGFYSSWDTEPADPLGRPTKIMFGYKCVPLGTDITDADAEAFVKSLDVRGISIPMRLQSAYDLTATNKVPLARDLQVAQLVVAQDGVAGGVAGLPSYPLLVTRSFPLGDRCIENC